MSLSDDKQADIVVAFGTASRYLDDTLNINNVCFDNIVSRVYPSELQPDRACALGAEVVFLDLHLSVSSGVVSARVCDGRDDFGFGVFGFPFLGGGVLPSAFCGVCVSWLVRFDRASGHVADFSARNKLLTQRLLGWGCRCQRLCTFFSKFYRRYYDLVSRFQVGHGYLLLGGLSTIMVTWCINWRGLLALIIFQRSSLK